MMSSLLIAQTARAQSRPLVTEDPETVPSGHMLVEAGVDYQHQVFYPASGLTGNLWRVGTVGLSFGVSPIAEIQLDGGIHNHLSITKFEPAPLASMLTVTGTSTGDFEDITIGSNESGLGLDTTDFNFDVNIGKTVRSTRVVGNIGFGILGDPIRGDSQNDVLNYGVSLARAMRQDVELVFEIAGRANTRANTPPPGTESRSVMRVGGRFTHGEVRIDAALMFG